MINSDTFKIAQTYADAFQEVTGKVIIAAGSSHLTNLVGLSHVGTLPEDASIQYADVLQATTSDSTDGPSLHTASIGAQIDSLIPMVSGHINYIQNQVRPKVISFEESLRKAVVLVNSQKPMDMFDVIQMDAPAPIANEDFMALVTHFADDNLMAPGPVASLPAQSFEQLVELMSVSSSSADESVKKWIMERGETWLLDIWNYYFASTTTIPSGKNPITGYQGNFAGFMNQPVFQRMDTALAVFLLSRGLLDSPLDDSGMDLPTWRATMDAISRFSGAQVKAAVRAFGLITDAEALIIGVFDNARRILVYTPVYQKFLESGGSVEDILGAALSGRSNVYNLQMFVESGVNYRNVWEHNQAVAQATLDMKALTSLRNEAKALFEVTMQPTDEDEASLLNRGTGVLNSMRSQATDVIDALALKNFSDTVGLSLKLIAGIRFSHTPAEKFLTNMLEAEAAGCKSPQEAASVAALSYLCDYMASNLALSNP